MKNINCAYKPNSFEKQVELYIFVNMLPLRKIPKIFPERFLITDINSLFNSILKNIQDILNSLSTLQFVNCYLTFV